MTRKDYEKFAVLLRRTNPCLKIENMSAIHDRILEHHVLLIEEIAAIFKEDNSNFDTQRFINKIISR